MKSSALVLLLALALTACGSEDPAPEPNQAADTPEATEPTVPSDPVEPAEAAVATLELHPHPEWAEVEIDPSLIVSEITPEEYEAQIRKALLHHGTKEDPVPLSVDFLGGWKFDETLDDPFPPHVRAINGAYVTMKGFMLPDVDFEGITDFQLVRSLWGCCFGAPPRVNELVRVFTPDDAGIEYTYNTLEIVGRMEVVFAIEDGLIEDLYRVHSEQILEGEFNDPLAPESAKPEDLVDQLQEMEF